MRGAGFSCAPHFIFPAHFSFERSAALSVPAASFSVLPAALYLHSTSGKPPFCCQTSKAGCTSRRKPAVPGSPPPAPCRGGWPVLLRRAAPGQSPVPAPEARHTQSGQRPARQNISVPFFQPFQALLHGGNVFRKFIGSIFLGICQRCQKHIFLRTQFLQILCQCRNLSRQFPVPEYMNRRERLFLGKQTAALLRLIPNVLCKLIVLCEGRAQRMAS